MGKKTLFLTKAAVIAALYGVLTLFGAALGLSYGGVQFRFSEALCILPLFTSSAIPGLAVGCFGANLLSTVSPFDAVFGTLATLLAAVLTRALKNVKVKNYPLCSMLMPLLCNGLIVGAEIAFFTLGDSFLPAFAFNGITVVLGEAAVMFTLGSLLYHGISSNSRLKHILSDSPETGKKTGRNTADEKEDKNEKNYCCRR